MKSKKLIAGLVAAMSLSIAAGCQSQTPSSDTTQNSGTTKTYSLDFNAKNYTSKTLTVNNKTVTYRAYEKIVYVKNPVDTTYQIMNIYIPEDYFNGKSIGSYTKDTAPIFFPNNIGGYMPAAPGGPGQGGMGGMGGHGGMPGGDQGGNASSSQKNTPPTGTAAGKDVGQGGAQMGTGGVDASSVALSKGYIVASPGARGRTTQDSSGKYTGKAPAAIVDLKAAVRYLRYNDKAMPGDAEKIISDGTSAGGAMSALLGASGNNSDYEPYLKKLGAAETRDDIFASVDYCPITNLDNADPAYEWVFNGLNSYNNPMGGGSGTMSSDQIKLSNELKKLFPEYVNSLGLKSADGNALKLNANGEGTFKTYLKSYIIASAQKALNSGTDLSKYNWITIKNGTVTDIDWDEYIETVGRMKSTPAFDAVDLSAAENDEFGTATVKAQHFTKFSQDNSTDSGSSIADSKIIKMMNPMNYIGAKGTTTAPHFRIRYGSIDANTSLAVPAILATKLQNSGYDADFAIPWGVGHAGDYDLDDLFAWTDKISKEK